MTYRIQIGGVNLEAVHGDIATQPDMTAIVNAANAQLMPGGGGYPALKQGQEHSFCVF